MPLNESMTSDQADLAWFVDVATGRTSQQRRPLEERTLLGSSGHCHLKFAEGLPPVHSVFHAGPDGVTVECLHPSPPLLVDGEAIRTHLLQDGQSVCINGIELRFSLQPVDEAVQPAVAQSPVTTEPSRELPPLLRARRPARAVLGRCLTGVQDEPVGVRRAA